MSAPQTVISADDDNGPDDGVDEDGSRGDLGQAVRSADRTDHEFHASGEGARCYQLAVHVGSAVLRQHARKLAVQIVSVTIGHTLFSPNTFDSMS